ncbi:MAG: MFS transporter [Desulfobacterales bacterium]|jgi:MFS family permease
MIEPSPPSPFEIRNIRRFIAFRVYFNARFYYPVFAVLFLDFGISLEEFALLNTAWAATIVLFEVPSGALADIIGRRNLLVVAGALMVVEISLLCLAPQGQGALLLTILLANRILSGLAEAAASGADEALAFDALKRDGRPQDWGRVLEKQIRYQSIGFVVAMGVGAAVYDPALLNRIMIALGLSVRFNPEMTLRLPLFLTLIMAFGALRQTLGMEEVDLAPTAVVQRRGSHMEMIGQAFRLTFQAGGWILRTPMALCVIMAGMLFDHVIRVVITLNSQYLRSIHYPEASFGLIGAGLALMGLFIPKIAARMDNRFSVTFNFAAVSMMAVIGLIGIAFFWPYAGLLPLALLSAVMMFTQFFSSRYLNQVTASEQRATVLSFRGLSYNLAYGLAGLLYALLLAFLRRQPTILAAADGNGLEMLVFERSFLFIPGYFILMLAVLILLARHQLQHR